MEIVAIDVGTWPLNRNAASLTEDTRTGNLASSKRFSKNGAGTGTCPACSIHFVTCHDGFTLNDLVSCRHRHNEAHPESNRDETGANSSENYGAAGETTNAGIEALRKGQIKNFLLALFISRGVPRLLGGDESCRTQGGLPNWFNARKSRVTCLIQERETYADHLIH